jgi:hypothetical protein
MTGSRVGATGGGKGAAEATRMAAGFSPGATLRSVRADVLSATPTSLNRLPGSWRGDAVDSGAVVTTNDASPDVT